MCKLACGGCPSLTSAGLAALARGGALVGLDLAYNTVPALWAPSLRVLRAGSTAITGNGKFEWD